MFQFPRFPSSNLCIQSEDDAGDLRPGAGFPHSEIPGSQPAHGSPRLIAVFHVLLRHLAPRHPPYALSSLTIRDAEKLTFFTPIFSGFAENWLAAIQLLMCVRLNRCPTFGLISQRHFQLFPSEVDLDHQLRYTQFDPARGRVAPACAFGRAYSVLSSACVPQTPSFACRSGGDEGTRTPDPCLAKAVLSQLSYIPIKAIGQRALAL
jgi:hypothetical protein